MVDPTFLAALLAIIGINLVLAGDNAIVIALAANGLPKDLQRKAIIWGTVLAVALRIVLTAAVVVLLQVPFLKLVGGLLLLWIAYKLATEEDAEHDFNPADTLRSAIITILMADLVMSLDNVLAVAARANGDYLLIVLGLLISIPIVMGGATLLLRLIQRFPVVVWIGAWLIAYTGIELIVSEPVIHDSELYHSIPGAVRVAAEIGLSMVLIAVAWISKLRARAMRVGTRPVLEDNAAESR